MSRLHHGRHDPKVSELHVNSANCTKLTEGFTTALEIVLAAPITVTDEMHFLSVTLSSADIPYTMYNISSNIGTTGLFMDSAAGLVLTPGNYDIDELCAAITASVAFEFSATIDFKSAKITLTNTDGVNPHTINFSESSSQGLAKMMGFALTDQTVAASGTIVSDYTVNLNPISTIYMYTDLPIDNVQTTFSGGNYESILDKIELRSDDLPFGKISFSSEDTAPFHAKIRRDRIERFRIYIRDQNNILLDLNNNDLEFTLHFKEKEAFKTPVNTERKRIRPNVVAPAPETPTPFGTRRAPSSSLPRNTSINFVPTPTFSNPRAPTPATFPSPTPIPRVFKPPAVVPEPEETPLDSNAIELQNAMLAAHALSVDETL